MSKKKIKILKSSVTLMRRISKDIALMRNNYCALIVYCLEITRIMRYVQLIKQLKLKEIF